MLNWLRRLLAPPQPAPTLRGDYVTREELEKALEAVMRDAEFELNEWHEKFATLHARLSKRVKRDQAAVPVINGHAEVSPARPSILHLPRKPWSI